MSQAPVHGGQQLDNPGDKLGDKQVDNPVAHWTSHLCAPVGGARMSDVRSDVSLTEPAEAKPEPGPPSSIPAGSRTSTAASQPGPTQASVTDHPMQVPAQPIQGRCGAHCRRTGLPCRRFPVKGHWRCRQHGGRATGARSAAGRDRIRQATLRHGKRSQAAEAARSAVTEFFRCASLALTGDPVAGVRMEILYTPTLEALAKAGAIRPMAFS